MFKLSAFQKICLYAVFEILGLAHVQNFPAGIFEKIHAGLKRKVFYFYG